MAGDVDSRRFAAEKLEEQKGGMLYAERRMLADGRLEELADRLRRRSKRALVILAVFAAVGVLYLAVGLLVMDPDAPIRSIDPLHVVTMVAWFVKHLAAE